MEFSETDFPAAEEKQLADLQIPDGLQMNSPFLETELEEDFFSILPDAWRTSSSGVGAPADWGKAIRQNRLYSKSLGWENYLDKIRRHFLQTTGKPVQDPDTEAFAVAVAHWQRLNGFAGKEIDGSLGPATWNKLRAQLNIFDSSGSMPAATGAAIDMKAVSRVLAFDGLINSTSQQHALNPNIVRAIIVAESGGAPRTGEGRSGYKGLMQAGTSAEHLEPEVSIKAGIEKYVFFRDKVLNPWLTKLGIDRAAMEQNEYLKMVLSCYNAGPVTALKAIQYAHAAGDIRNWLQEDHYKRALVFSGGYAYYASCNKGASDSELAEAKKERKKYRFKSSKWRSEKDPAAWAVLVHELHPIMRCWIETKYRNTPHYLNKFIQHYIYFESTLQKGELEYENIFERDETDEQEGLELFETPDLEEQEENAAAYEDDLYEDSSFENESYGGDIAGDAPAMQAIAEEPEEDTVELEDEEAAYEAAYHELFDDEFLADEAELEEYTAANEVELAEISDSEVDDALSLTTEDFEVSLRKGTTAYLNVSAVKQQRLKTGVFIPAGYQSSDQVDVVLYFHGLYRYADKSNGIEYYWKDYANIREYFHASGRNAILLAPTLGHDPQRSKLLFYADNGLDTFLSACLSELIAKSYVGPSAALHRIILAAHSAGGSPMSAVLRRNNACNAKITMCWGFDCLYNYQWEQALQKNPDISFLHFWAHKASGSISGPGARGNTLAKQFPNVENIKPEKMVYHRQIIAHAWLQYINARSWFSPINALAGEEPEVDVEGELSALGETVFSAMTNWFQLSPVKRAIIMIASDSGQKSEQAALELAVSQNITDANELTNLIFYKRHRAYLGRKLQSTDPQNLKDEWVAIQRNIVMPFLKKGVPAVSPPTAPAPASTPISGTGSASLGPFRLVKMSLSTQPLVLIGYDKDKRYAEIKEAPSVFLSAIVRKAGYDPEKWFTSFTRTTFLGRELNQNQYVHVTFAEHLKKLEEELAVKYGGTYQDPKVAGDYLELANGMSGSRLVSGTATYSYHMFGLALDVNYAGNPYIRARSAFNKFMMKVGQLVQNGPIREINWRPESPMTSEGFLKLYDSLAAANKQLVEYFSYIDNPLMLQVKLAASGQGHWSGKTVDRARAEIKKNLQDLSSAWKGSRQKPEEIFKKSGIMTLTRNLVKGMVESGLDWGAWYGDIMHFDMRRTAGTGAKIEDAKTQYIAEKKAQARSLFAKNL